MGGAEGGEHHHELGGRLAQQLGLAYDLRCHPVVRQAAAGEDRQLLSARQRVHAVDGGDAGLDELARIRARRRVERLAVDVATVGGYYWRAAVARQPATVEYATEDVARHRQLERLVEETHPGAFQV